MKNEAVSQIIRTYEAGPFSVSGASAREAARTK
jgi:hypothetical protein